MKKIYILTAVFALLTLSLNAQPKAQAVKASNRATNSVTVGDQTSDTQYLPVYGWWYDGYEQNQMIYTAEQLGNLPAGTKITSITFYPYNGLFLNGGTIKLSLGTTSANSFTSANAISATDLTLVATITPTSNSNMTEWTITFTNDFIYNGGNLLVQTDTEDGSDTRSYFYGQQQQNYVCYYSYSYYSIPSSGSRSNILPKATFTYEEAGPTIEVSPETLTINDSGTDNTFTVQGKNLGTDNVGVTVPNGSAFSTTTSDKTWGFENTTGSVEGTVTVTYGGRALRATETVTVANNLTSATVAVTYVPDLYIYCDNGASPWDFSANPAVAMTNNGDGTYTATLEDIPANSHILFGRASGLTYGWEGDNNRLFFGASTDGGDWGYGDNTSGYLDTNAEDDYPVKYHPIYFSEGGTYIVTIDANAYTFSIIGKTATPTITVVANADGSKTVSATGNGTVHLYVDGVEVDNPYTILPSLDGDKAYTVTATAQEEGKLISETAEQIVTVAEAGRTPTPVITVEEHNGYVVITAQGDGTVTLNAGGQTAIGEGSASITIVKSNEEQTVTATATAQDGDLAESYEATKEVTILALNTTPTNPASGLLRLHLLIVDQMKEEIPDDNSHPDKYGYVLRYEPNGPEGEGVKESGTVYVDIQKADCEVMGAYTLNEVDNDKHIGAYDPATNTIKHDLGITMNAISADVEYNLSSDNDILYAYLLQGAENRVPGYQADYLTELQKTQNFTYVEMEESNPNKGTEYPNGEHHYFVGTDNLKTGAYGSSYMSYAPSVSTWGISRRYYEDDGYDNTYGAPIWTTGAGEVTMNGTPKAERQDGKDGSTNWEYEGEACSLYILDNIEAVGKVPHSGVATVEYEPYMFRVFVESKKGLLRNFQKVDGDGVNTGEHYEGIAGDTHGPICVWSGYVVDDGKAGQTFTPGTTGSGSDAQPTLTFKKVKVDRTGGSNVPQPGEWDQDETNAIFAAVDALAITGYDNNGKPILNENITSDDLNIFVRFYYVVAGSADNHEVHSGRRDGDSSRPGNGAESPGTSPEPATGVHEIQFLGEIVSTTYYNVQGMESDQPFDGVNVVVTRYSNGTTSVTKVVR